jgi:5-dehydro-4-deoxyglucarate dehydratase
MPCSPESLKSALGAGLLSFPVTHLMAGGVFDQDPLRRHIDYRELAGLRPTC